ncbi:GntR family transcriptional regulator [Pelagibacterium xiamenense]|uniref:GntR family transcriptional regulator n=1 Tax=Pelagibacterium xiamenense TaxID=2901140 RepID=UPI001E549D3F|nr:GntR family transcriptional regulator [Pelagibacterium xiamenense]MCD7058815.1 GntR family transcriptional regulator [Pelagibacterium xiamenense]
MQQTIGDIFRRGTEGGPLYLRLRRAIAEAVDSGLVTPGQALPSERELAASMDISRVTVRKAVEDLVREGVLVQRHGSGTFVAPKVTHVEQTLSSLTSFTEDMARRGLDLRSIWLERGLCPPSPEETVVLGLSSDEQVARIARLRIADGTPLAIERASLSASILPNPTIVTSSLYAVLDASGHRPVRAIQRIAAMNLGADEAKMLETTSGAAALRIERTSYLASGRIVEFTRSIYRGDAYDFVAELRLQNR